MTFTDFKEQYLAQHPEASSRELLAEYARRHSFNGKLDRTQYFATPSGSILPNRFAGWPRKRTVLRQGKRHIFHEDGTVTIVSPTPSA